MVTEGSLKLSKKLFPKRVGTSYLFLFARHCEILKVCFHELKVDHTRFLPVNKNDIFRQHFTSESLEKRKQIAG